MPHKHAFVGTDAEGTDCIYVLYIDADGATGAYFTATELQGIADKINDMRVLPPPTDAEAAAQGGR